MRYCYSVVPHLMLERMENMICDSCLWVIVIANKKPIGCWNVPAPHAERMGREWWLFLVRLHSSAGTVLSARLATPTAPQQLFTCHLWSSGLLPAASLLYHVPHCWLCIKRFFTSWIWENKRPTDIKQKRVQSLSLEFVEGKKATICNQYGQG